MGVTSSKGTPLRRSLVSCLLALTPSFAVIGGASTTLGEFPWNVRITHDNILGVCSGVLISDNMVLTAAHCIKSSTSSYKLWIGGSSIDNAEIATNPPNRAQHINYNSGAIQDQVKNDVGVIALRYKTTKQPIKLSPKPPAEGQTVYVLGWGRTQPNGANSSTLQRAETKVINSEACKAIYQASGERDWVDALQFCTDSPNGIAQGACLGDSGGPVVWMQGGEWLLYGVIHGGMDAAGNCDQPGKPGRSTAVGFYQSWFMTHTAFTLPTFAGNYWPWLPSVIY